MDCQNLLSAQVRAHVSTQESSRSAHIKSGNATASAPWPSFVCIGLSEILQPIIPGV